MIRRSVSRSSLRRGYRFVAIAGAAVAIAALAACGGGKSATKTTGAVQAANSAEFGLSDNEIERRQIKVEALIQTCMKTQGFDYTPVDPATLRAAMNGNSKPSGVTDQQFAKQYGYGITTLYDAQLLQGQKAQGAPNKKIRDALRPADLAAYDRALYGDNPAATFASALDSENLGGLGGCTKQAVDAVFPASELKVLRAKSQDAVGDRALQDPRVIEATRKWSTCMRAAGYAYAKPDEIKLDIRNKLAAIVGAAPRSLPVGADPTKFVTYDRQAMATLQAQETGVATADFACATKVGLKAVKTKVEAEIAKSMGI